MLMDKQQDFNAREAPSAGDHLSKSGSFPSLKGPKYSSERCRPTILRLDDLESENNSVIMEMLQNTPQGTFDWSRKPDSPGSSSSDDDRDFSLRQRTKQKINSAASSPMRAPTMDCVQSPSSSSSSSTTRSGGVGAGIRVRPRRVIYIQDYDFRTTHLEISEGNYAIYIGSISAIIYFYTEVMLTLIS